MSPTAQNGYYDWSALSQGITNAQQAAPKVLSATQRNNMKGQVAASANTSLLNNLSSLSSNLGGPSSLLAALSVSRMKARPQAQVAVQMSEIDQKHAMQEADLTMQSRAQGL